MVTTTTPQHVTIAALRERGWTASLIRDHLGGPDMLRPNRYYAIPTHLYDLTHVEVAEQSPAWQAAQERARKRQASARIAAAKTREAAEKQRQALVDWARTVPVEWTPPTWEDCTLARLGLPGRADDKMIQARLRHQHTNYESLLAQMDVLVDRSARRQDIQAYAYAHQRAYETIKRRVNQRVEQAMGVVAWEPDRTVWGARKPASEEGEAVTST